MIESEYFRGARRPLAKARVPDEHSHGFRPRDMIGSVASAMGNSGER